MNQPAKPLRQCDFAKRTSSLACSHWTRLSSYEKASALWISPGGPPVSVRAHTTEQGLARVLWLTVEEDAHEVPEGTTFERHPLRRFSHHQELQLRGAYVSVVAFQGACVPGGGFHMLLHCTRHSLSHLHPCQLGAPTPHPVPATLRDLAACVAGQKKLIRHVSCHLRWAAHIHQTTGWCVARRASIFEALMHRPRVSHPTASATRAHGARLCGH
jgi:hypothetical protein